MLWSRERPQRPRASACEQREHGNTLQHSVMKSFTTGVAPFTVLFGMYFLYTTESFILPRQVHRYAIGRHVMLRPITIHRKEQ